MLTVKQNSGLALLPALALGAVTALVVVADLRPAPATGEMAVVFAPWVSNGQAVQEVVAAGGALAASSRLPNIVIAYANDVDFAARVRDRGAWLLFAATGLCAAAVPNSLGQVI